MNDELVSISQKQSVSNNFDYIGIEDVILSLKPEHQAILDILYFKGYTQEEASKELNLPLGTLKTRARTAINNLRTLLKDKTIE